MRVVVKLERNLIYFSVGDYGSVKVRSACMRKIAETLAARIPWVTRIGHVTTQQKHPTEPWRRDFIGQGYVYLHSEGGQPSVRIAINGRRGTGRGWADKLAAAFLTEAKAAGVELGLNGGNQ